MYVYIHDYTGMEISEDAYSALPYDERRRYSLKKAPEQSSASDAVVDIVTAALIDGMFDSGSGSDDCAFGSDSSPSDSGFDGGFGGGDFSGGGANGDF